jgi:hypothetical protein
VSEVMTSGGGRIRIKHYTVLQPTQIRQPFHRLQGPTASTNTRGLAELAAPKVRLSGFKRRSTSLKRSRTSLTAVCHSALVGSTFPIMASRSFYERGARLEAWSVSRARENVQDQSIGSVALGCGRAVRKTPVSGWGLMSSAAHRRRTKAGAPSR